MPGVTLGVERDEAKRGEELRVAVTLDPRAAGADDPFEIGLVCVERYDYTARAQTKACPVNVRQTRDATAHEPWLPVEHAVGEQSVLLDIPATAPYSYEGECVSYAWRVSVRAARRLRADPADRSSNLGASVKLALELPGESGPGEHVPGTIRVEEGGESRSLTITVAFHKETRDYSVVPVRSDRVVHEGALATGQAIDFSFDLPAEAPPSVKCGHSEFWCEVSAHSADPGFDTRVGRRLEVVAG